MLHGDGYPEERTPIEVPRPATDHELLLVLARDLRAVALDVAEIRLACKELVPRSECAQRHPGARRWLEVALAIAALLGGLYGAWRVVVEPVLQKIDRAALAAALPPEPRVQVVREPLPMPVPIIVAPDARPPAAGAKKARTR